MASMGIVRSLCWPFIEKVFDFLEGLTSVDITKKALCILHERLQGSGIKIIDCIHGEIIIEAPITGVHD
jgi:hypothetical protein